MGGGGGVLTTTGCGGLITLPDTAKFSTVVIVVAALAINGLGSQTLDS
jgi:hypothetical protein